MSAGHKFSFNSRPILANNPSPNENGRFLEYDYDYDDFQYQVLYVTIHREELSEFQLRNLFSRFATINSIRILHDEKNMYYALVTLSSYTEAKKFIKASLLMKIDEKPIYVSFENKDLRYNYRKNYKYMVYQKIRDNMPLNTVLSGISQYQARALMHDSNLFDEWINLSWNFQ